MKAWAGGSHRMVSIHPVQAHSGLFNRRRDMDVFDRHLPSFKQQKLGSKRRNVLQVNAALFDPPPFDPAKLSVRYLPCLSSPNALVPRRRYTLTHNDITGALKLSIGTEYNRNQLDGWYTRILRDEVLAEWFIPSATDSDTDLNQPTLHVYCHVSGEETWPAPPGLRSFIFQREMTLVLDTIAYADRELIADASLRLAQATVYVHLVSNKNSLNETIEWGVLGDRESWQRAAPSSVFQQLVSSVLSSFSDEDEPPPRRVSSVSSLSSSDEDDGSPFSNGSSNNNNNNIVNNNNNGSGGGQPTSNSFFNSSEFDGTMPNLQPVEAILSDPTQPNR